LSARQSAGTDQSANVIQAMERALETERARGFSRISALRFSVGIFTDNVYDEGGSNWLKSTVMIPVEALGVKLTEQKGQPIDLTLPA
jgi:hypothetical protein